MAQAAERIFAACHIFSMPKHTVLPRRHRRCLAYVYHKMLPQLWEHLVTAAAWRTCTR